MANFRFQLWCLQSLIFVLTTSNGQTNSRNDEVFTIPEIEKLGVSRFYDYATKTIAYKDFILKKCYIQRMKTPDHWQSSRQLSVSENPLTRQEIVSFAGPRIANFCFGWLTKLLQEKDNDQPIRRYKRSNSHFFVGRPRGQTQSQYLNFGGSHEPGKAEAEISETGSRAVVTGNNGMGQAQSQSNPFSCSDCFGYGKVGGAESQFQTAVPGQLQGRQPFQIMTPGRTDQGALAGGTVGAHLPQAGGGTSVGGVGDGRRFPQGTTGVGGVGDGGRFPQGPAGLVGVGDGGRYPQGLPTVPAGDGRRFPQGTVSEGGVGDGRRFPQGTPGIGGIGTDGIFPQGTIGTGGILDSGRTQGTPGVGGPGDGGRYHHGTPGQGGRLPEGTIGEGGRYPQQPTGAGITTGGTIPQDRTGGSAGERQFPQGGDTGRYPQGPARGVTDVERFPHGVSSVQPDSGIPHGQLSVGTDTGRLPSIGPGTYPISGTGQPTGVVPSGVYQQAPSGIAYRPGLPTQGAYGPGVAQIAPGGQPGGYGTDQQIPSGAQTTMHSQRPTGTVGQQIPYIPGQNAQQGTTYPLTPLIYGQGQQYPDQRGTLDGYKPGQQYSTAGQYPGQATGTGGQKPGGMFSGSLSGKYDTPAGHTGQFSGIFSGNYEHNGGGTQYPLKPGLAGHVTTQQGPHTYGQQGGPGVGYPGSQTGVVGQYPISSTGQQYPSAQIGTGTHYPGGTPSTGAQYPGGGPQYHGGGQTGTSGLPYPGSQVSGGVDHKQTDVQYPIPQASGTEGGQSGTGTQYPGGVTGGYPPQTGGERPTHTVQYTQYPQGGQGGVHYPGSAPDQSRSPAGVQYPQGGSSGGAHQYPLTGGQSGGDVQYPQGSVSQSEGGGHYPQGGHPQGGVGQTGDVNYPQGGAGQIGGVQFAQGGGQPGGTGGVQYPSGTGGVQYPSGTGGVLYPSGAGGAQYPSGAGGGIQAGGTGAGQYPSGTSGGIQTGGTGGGQYPSRTGGELQNGGTGGVQYPSGTGMGLHPGGTGGIQYPSGTGGRIQPGGTGGVQYPSGTGAGIQPGVTGGVQYPSGTGAGIQSGGAGGTQYPHGGSQYPQGAGQSIGPQYPSQGGQQGGVQPGSGPIGGIGHTSVQPGAGQIGGIQYPPPSGSGQVGGVQDGSQYPQGGRQTEYPQGGGGQYPGQLIQGQAPQMGGVSYPGGHLQPGQIMGYGLEGAPDDSDSQAQTSVQQVGNDTQASATAQGKFAGGTAQSQVSGTYTGSGSFSASAGSDDGKRGAQTQVSGGKEGAISSAQGRGGLGQSQAQVQLGSETGDTTSSAQSGGINHGTNTQVQAGGKGGMADAQANGPGSTSSQAQIGFVPNEDEEEDDERNHNAPFSGGGTASAQSGSYAGQSQTQIHGRNQYGLKFTGGAQASSANNGAAPNPAWPVFKPFNYSPARKTEEEHPKPQKSTENKNFPTKPVRVETTTDIPVTTTTSPNAEEEYVEEYDEYDEHEENSEKPRSSRQQSQSPLEPLEDLQTKTTIVKHSMLREGDLLQPGTRIPGTPGYIIPSGFRGRVAHAESPNSNKFGYKPPVYAVGANSNLKNGAVGFGSGYAFQPVQYAVKSGKSYPKFISVTKSETGSKNLQTGKKTPSVYYTQSSSCGYFTNTCFYNNGQKICMPKPKTNPDGTPMIC